VLNHCRDKDGCWHDLKDSLDVEENTNIILGGDFNLILHANEKRGGSFTPNPYRIQLENIMQEHDLMDVPPKNRRYTCNSRRMGVGNIMERLDKILINITLLSAFSVGYANILTCSASDHFPITTLENHRPLGPIPFRYSALWNDTPVLARIVYSSWIQHVEGSPGFIWETKLRKTKQAIKEWAKTKYQEPEKVKKEIKNKLESIQREIEENGLSQENKQQENELYLQLYRVNREEETKWRLKSRQLWLQGGDKNSAFFHKQTTTRKIRNNVSSILDAEGDRQSTQGAIRRAATDHYQDLLTETKEAEDYTDLLQHLPTGISREMNDILSKEIDEEDIRRSI